MASWRLGMTSYYDIQLEVYRCQTDTDRDIDADDDSNPLPPTTPIHTTSTQPPLIKNVLGDNLYTSLQSFLAKESDVETFAGPEITSKEEVNLCEVISHFEVSADSLVVLCSVLLTFCLISVIGLCLCYLCRKYILGRDRKSHKSTSEIPQTSDTKPSTGGETVEHESSEETVAPEERQVSKITKKNSDASQLNCGIPLAYQPRLFRGSHTELDVSEFLNNTTEKLFAKLDRLLLQQAAETNQCQNHVSLSTPRFARRALNRRQRSGSSPSLPQLDTTSGQSENQNNEKVSAWIYFKRFCKQFAWTEPVLMKVDDSKYDRKVQRLLHYYQRVCPMISDHWATASMIVNYSLLILQSNLEKILCSNGYRFLHFASTGSGQLGCKVGKPNQFDVYMMLQPPVVQKYVIEDTSEESIPPGQMLIVADLPRDTTVPVREVVSQVKLNGHYRICLSSQKFARSAEELIETCLQTLYTKSRSLMDRLPFQIKRAPTANLVISIDTKALVGLNMPDIKLSIIPVLDLPMNGWYQSSRVYATRSLKEDEVMKYRPGSLGAVNPDFLWHVNLGDLNKIYMENINLKMLHAGVLSCNSVCLMILKALLTRGNKNTLLDRGVFASLHISTVLNFLLLESSPQQWQMDQLANRFSDVVHFLRAAFTNHRLPNFFINNPCLAEKMPLVKTNQFLQRRRQQNLLTDLRPEAFEKCLEYLEDCLRESGLQECVNDDYSEDMWEYEFFVY